MNDAQRETAATSSSATAALGETVIPPTSTDAAPLAAVTTIRGSAGTTSTTDGKLEVGLLIGVESQAGIGIYTTSQHGAALSAQGKGAGVIGSSGSAVGVFGQSTTAAGVYGASSTGPGVFGVSNTAGGVEGTSKAGAGVRGTTTSHYGTERACAPRASTARHLASWNKILPRESVGAKLGHRTGEIRPHGSRLVEQVKG